MFSKLFGSKNNKKQVDEEIDQVVTSSTTPSDKLPVTSSMDQFIAIQLAHSTGEKFSDKASTLLPLVEHHVKCHVTYPIVQVVSTMTFRNKNNKIIEGELTLPLPEGATVIGYAMEVEGKLIDAVPVEKEKAKEVFEELFKNIFEFKGACSPCLSIKVQ